MGAAGEKHPICVLTLDCIVELLLLLMLQCELLPLLLNVLLQGLELLAHDAILTLEPQASLKQRNTAHTRQLSDWQFLLAFL